MKDLGTLFVLAGVVLVALGIVFSLGGGLSWLGRLPGDIRIERPGFSLFFPVTTSIIVSVVISLVIYVVRMLR